MDFDALSDDQLVALIRAAVGEAVRRGEAVRLAAEAAMLAEAEKVRIAAEAAQREAARQRRQKGQRVAQATADRAQAPDSAQQRQRAGQAQQHDWARKKILARMVIAVLGSRWNLTVWERDGERRVFFDEAGNSRSRITYYDTGNGCRPPQSIDWGGGLPADAKPLVVTIAQQACREWETVKIDCDVAARAEVGGDVILPPEIIAYQIHQAKRESLVRLQYETRRLSELLEAKARIIKEAARQLALVSEENARRSAEGAYANNAGLRQQDLQRAEQYQATRDDALAEAADLHQRRLTAQAALDAARAAVGT